MAQPQDKYNAGYDQNNPPQYMMQPPIAQPYAVAMAPRQPGPPINDHLVWSILSCLCCFWPTGIAAIVYSSRVKDAQMLGDTVGAQSASSTARTLNIITTTIGSICHATWIILVIVFVALGLGLASSTASDLSDIDIGDIAVNPYLTTFDWRS